MGVQLKILALEPYFGGSHRQFLQGWVERSRHDWELLTLPPTKWKWRMRHAPLAFCEEVAEARGAGRRWDLVFCSDMLDLAAFRGLAPAEVRDLPSVAYFHENQLTYPVQCEDERDYHFVFSNMTTALAAREVWFNSAFHRDSFLTELGRFLRKMPDRQPMHVVEDIRSKASVRSPRVESPPPRGPRRPGPPRLLWAARWEYDKGPETFFGCLRRLVAKGMDFRLSVLGGWQGRQVSPVFEEARREFSSHIEHWGFIESAEEYRKVLGDVDVVISTAEHEFFGIAVVEAVAHGAYALVPERLAYPEVLGGEDDGRDSFFYRGDELDLSRRLAQLARRIERDGLWQGDPDRGRRRVEKYAWANTVHDWDDALERLAEPGTA